MDLWAVCNLLYDIFENLCGSCWITPVIALCGVEDWFENKAIAIEVMF